MNEKKRVLSIGAHPDDADTSSGGLLMKLRDAGYDVRMLSVTDGSCGTYRDNAGEELALQRRSEAAASGRLLGGRYDVLDYPDGGLAVNNQTRDHLIRYIRRYAPDVIITNRISDYHVDHRNTATLVQDVAFLLTVPAVCPDVAYMKKLPLILFWHDDFILPTPFRPDIVVPMSKARVEALVAHASCHESQYFDWMYYPDQTEMIAWPREEQLKHLTERYLCFTKCNRDATLAILAEKHGAEQAELIQHAELFEISEYGCRPDAEFLKIAEMPE